MSRRVFPLILQRQLYFFEMSSWFTSLVRFKISLSDIIIFRLVLISWNTLSSYFQHLNNYFPALFFVVTMPANRLQKAMPSKEQFLCDVFWLFSSRFSPILSVARTIITIPLSTIHIWLFGVSSKQIFLLLCPFGEGVTPPSWISSIFHKHLLYLALKFPSQWQSDFGYLLLVRAVYHHLLNSFWPFTMLSLVHQKKDYPSNSSQ